MRPEVCVVPLEAVESILVDDAALRVLCLLASGTVPQPMPEGEELSWETDISDRVGLSPAETTAALSQLIEAGFLLKTSWGTYDVILARPSDFPLPRISGAVEPPTPKTKPKTVRRGISLTQRYR